MAYRIEFSQPLGLPFTAEFLLTDQATGLPVTIGDNQPEFSVFRGYGDYWPFFVANQTSGFLSVAEPGLIQVSIPPHCWGFGPPGYGGWWCGPMCLPSFSIPFRLVVRTSDPAAASLIADGTISFGVNL